MTTRRQALTSLLGAGAAMRVRAAGIASGLEQHFGEAQGVGVVVDFATGHLLAAHRMDVAATLLAPPGSTMKPLSLLALLGAGKLRVSDTHLCSGDLRIAGRSFACSHPRTSAPIDLSTAIAYSCNEYVARAAARMASGELAAAFSRFGLASRTGLGGTGEAAGRIERAAGPEANQLQALGEERIAVTVLELAAAYRRLAQYAGRPEMAGTMAPIIEGMEGAVNFGTAQRAAVPDVSVAGKTGSAAGRYAWFAGFAPSRAPRFVAAVMVQGHAGGSDAAPIGGRILAAGLEGRL